jgi:hypothetical protein
VPPVRERTRWIGRLIGWLEERRPIATRSEKLVQHYLVVVTLARVEKCVQLTLPVTP